MDHQPRDGRSHCAECNELLNEIDATLHAAYPPQDARACQHRHVHHRQLYRLESAGAPDCAARRRNGERQADSEGIENAQTREWIAKPVRIERRRERRKKEEGA